MFQQKPNYSQHCNQRGVSVSTKLTFLQARYELGLNSVVMHCYIYKVIKQSQ